MNFLSSNKHKRHLVFMFLVTNRLRSDSTNHPLGIDNCEPFHLIWTIDVKSPARYIPALFQKNGKYFIKDNILMAMQEALSNTGTEWSSSVKMSFIQYPRSPSSSSHSAKEK